MALKKEIRQADGVTTSYHRILYLMQNVNNYTAIAVLSYVDDEARGSEKDNTLAQPYKISVTHQTAYAPDMTVSTAYEYLKTLPLFEGAVDV